MCNNQCNPCQKQEAWLDRLIAEQKLEQENIDKLQKFLDNNPVNLDNEQHSLMTFQLEFMMKKNEVLKQRIALAQENEQKKEKAVYGSASALELKELDEWSKKVERSEVGEQVNQVIAVQTHVLGQLTENLEEKVGHDENHALSCCVKTSITINKLKQKLQNDDDFETDNFKILLQEELELLEQLHTIQYKRALLVADCVQGFAEDVEQ